MATLPRTSVKPFPVNLPALPLVDAQATNKQYVDQQDETKVSKTGDTLTGPLILSGPPAAANEAATKAYVDDAVSTPTAADVSSTPTGDVVATNVQDAIAELASEKVAKHGDTMTGALILSSLTPATDYTAAPKHYVDTMGSYEVDYTSGDYTWDAGLGMYTLTVSHTLNRRPKVTIYDTDGKEVIGDVVYNLISTNGLTIRLKSNIDITVLLT